MRRIAIVAAGLAVMLASCTTEPSDDTKARAAKIFDTVCPLEPVVYAGFDAYASTHNVSAKVQRIVADADVVVTKVCKNRPTDIVTGSITLLSAYAQIAAGLGGNAPKINL